MFRVLIDHCIGCEVCVDICPEEAISMTGEDVAWIDPEKCASCGVCADICAQDAIEEGDAS